MNTNKTLLLALCLLAGGCCIVPRGEVPEAAYDGRHDGVWTLWGDMVEAPQCGKRVAPAIVLNAEFGPGVVMGMRDGVEPGGCVTETSLTNVAASATMDCGLRGRVTADGVFERGGLTMTYTVDFDGCPYTYELQGQVQR